jgi:hypothetical protein
MPLYFAYGSNMDRDAMTARCPRSRPLGPARLARHRLAIMPAGYLSVLRDPRRSVWGLLWDLALADGPALDRYEDVGSGLYRKDIQPVLTGEGPRRALIYVGTGQGGRPRPGYLEAVLVAARPLLPAGYVRELEALLPGGPRTGVTPLLAAVAPVRPTRGSPMEAPPPRADWSWEP